MRKTRVLARPVSHKRECGDVGSTLSHNRIDRGEVLYDAGSSRRLSVMRCGVVGPYQRVLGVKSETAIEKKRCRPEIFARRRTRRRRRRTFGGAGDRRTATQRGAPPVVRVCVHLDLA